MPVHRSTFQIFMDLSALYTGLGDRRSMESSCTFKEVSVDQEEYPKEDQMALEVWSTESDSKNIRFAFT